MSDLKQNNQLSIELDEQIAEGIYSNLVVINHSDTEFVLDFVNVMPGLPKAKVKSRIILAPQHAQRLLISLTENLQKYQSTNGPISGGSTPVSINNLGSSGNA